MENTTTRGGGSCLSMVLAMLAIVIACVAFAQVWLFRLSPQFHGGPGSTYVVFRSPDNDLAGAVEDDYADGFLFRRLDAKRARRIEMRVGDEGVSFTLYRNEVPVARWTLDDDGERFEKLAGGP